jgi:hypothetical protein
MPSFAELAAEPDRALDMLTLALGAEMRCEEMASSPRID